jgi:GntR family transcriptional regulator
VKQGTVSGYLRGLAERSGLDYGALYRRYRELTHERLDQITLIPGAAETLAKLRAAGAEHFLYTHRGKSTETLLDRLELKPFFTEIVTFENGFQPKPSGEGVAYLAGKYGLDPETTAYVGDRTLDVLCAKDAGVKAVLYLPEDSCVIPTGQEDLVIGRLEELTKEGLLQRRQGKGTFVSTPHLFRDLKHINSFGSVCRMTGATPGTQVIRTAVIPAGEEDLTHQLAPSGGSVVETVRLRLANHEPVMLETNHFPIRFDWLLEEDLSGSLYDVLRRRKAEPRDAIHEISLVYADGDTAQMLDVPEGTALLQLDQMIFDQNGQPLHSSRQLIRGDRFTFRI